MRDTMTSLVARLRTMIGDTGETPVWTDDELQDALDARGSDQRMLRLTEEPTYADGSSTPEYTTFTSGLRDWEGSVVLVDRTHALVTVSTEDAVGGSWLTADDQTGATPLYATGRTYDVRAAAADVLEAWAARLAREFDFSTDGASFERSQQHAMLLEQAAQYRSSASKARGGIARMGGLW